MPERVAMLANVSAQASIGVLVLLLWTAAPAHRVARLFRR